MMPSDSPSALSRSLFVVPLRWFGVLWSHRGLLKQFVNRDIRGRFAGSIAGLLWTVLMPLSQIITYFFLFSVIIKIRLPEAEIGTGSFLIFFLAGLFPWLAFSEALSRATGILQENTNLITKVIFPTELLPASAALSAFFFNGVGFLIFLVYLVSQGFFGWTWLLIPFLVCLLFLFSIGAACFLSALCVFLRDTQQLLGIVLTIWFYFTPILYPISMVPESMRSIMKINPMLIYVDLFRQALLKHEFDMVNIVICIFFSLLTFFLGTLFFDRLKYSFSDVL